MVVLQLTLQHFVERVEEADEEGEFEGVIFDQFEPIEAGRVLHTNLLPG